MATVNVKIHKHEKDRMIVVIASKENKGKTLSVAALAKQAGYNPNRTRFILEEMLQEGSIRKVPTKKFNEHYVRYSYEVTGK